ncbi:PREDICTED: uncharacterized protein K02A2.6-like [Vollenhovia emeryi]|uniref:uncharacterized protein K02A2.6-like n=1 Tax=Vollenhovia emeryi TaxID=411798 RepID=UPI0005F45CD3|nr:PREDICTED: uncharacterized protein K02A2.6-like [Vollenhovia emeryi]
MSLREATTFTVAELKTKLQALQLSVSGTKAELIARLNEADPSGEWRGNDEDQSMLLLNERNAEDLQREVDLLNREHEVLRRELEIARRELAMARARNNDDHQPNGHSRANIRMLSELLKEFSGAHDGYWQWEQQARLLKDTYQLDDDSARILLGSRLRGSASEWFHSNPEHLGKTFEELLSKMKDMYDHRPTMRTLRRQFENRRWKTTEPFSEYYNEKVILANRIQVAEEELIDCLIEGIPDPRLRTQARFQGFATKELLLKAFMKESLHQEKDETKSRPGSSGQNKQETGKQNTGQIRRRISVPGTSNGTASGSQTGACHYCKKEDHMKFHCPELAKKGKCYSCGKPGHMSRECPNKESEVNHVDAALTRDDEYLRRVTYEIICNKNNCETVELDTLLDTGSPVSFIKLQNVSSQAIEPVDEQRRFHGINRSSLIVLGAVSVDMKMDGKILKNIQLIVVPDYTMSSSVVLGRDVLRKLGLGLGEVNESSKTCLVEAADVMSIDIVSGESESALLTINPDVPFETQERVREMFCKEYLESECPIEPREKGEIKLTLTSNQPFHFRPRRLSYAEKDKVREIINRLLEKGIIKSSQSEYASPIVLVNKKNGETRMCIDYRALNKITARDNYPLLLIEDQLDILNEKKYFTVLDLKDGFHHIFVAEDSTRYTAFVTPLGQYEYVKMPFGLKGAPSAFQRWVNQVLKEFIDKGDVVAYLDDFLIATETIEQHLRVLKNILITLVANKIQLRIDKCKFLFTEIEYLGYKISREGVRPTENGIAAIVRFPIPRDLRGVKRFLGMCSYFRKFIEGFSTLAKPLTDLTRKNAEFRFGEKELQVFEILKQKLIASPILSIYSPRDETELHCDASSVGFGAVLMQKKLIVSSTRYSTSRNAPRLRKVNITVSSSRPCRLFTRYADSGYTCKELNSGSSLIVIL